MPDSDALIRLRKRLQAALDTTAVLRSKPWVSPKPMRDALRAVESSFDGVEAVPEAQSLRGAVLTFLRTPQKLGFRDLKYVCFGVTLAFNNDEERLVDRPDAFRLLLREVDEQQGEARRFRRCYQALLQSYFAFQSVDEQSPNASNDPAFQTLRGFLTDRLEVVVKLIGGRSPGWALVLKEHANLLTDQPCNRYTSQLALGKTDELSKVCAGLGISRQSWVWQEVILAYLKQICDRPDSNFKYAIDTALDLAEGKAAIVPSTATSRTVASRLVKRYSECTAQPELPRLRDICVEYIGNPWVRKSAWDAWVRHEPARQLVDSWLKSKIMEDFFTLLSDQTGEATDKRRLKYWLKYVPVITDMWFVLGAAARRNRSPEYKAVLSRMAGRRPELEPSQGEGNNAFIMKIGSYYFIEFGAKGNACFYYRGDELPFDLSSHRLSIHDLKALKSRRTSHVPSATWEQEFDKKFRPLMGESLPPSQGGRPNRVVPTGVVAKAHTPSPAPVRPTTPAPRAGGASVGRALEASPISPPSAATPPPASATWPTYTPPRAKADHASTSEASDSDIKAALVTCELQGIGFRDFRERYGSVWVHRDANKHARLKYQLSRLGFRTVEREGREGLWLGPDVALGPASSKPTADDFAKADKRAIADLLAECLRHGVRYEDFRDRRGGGNLWVYTDPTTHPDLVSELYLLGFKFTSKRGFWLEGEDS